MRGIAAAGLALCILLCTGCASVTQGTTHSLRIETATDQGELVDGADCTLINDHGTSIAKSGTSTQVRRSSQDLEITCAAGGRPDAKGRLVSRANAGLAGNILIGGGIGAIIDHNTGAAYTYPTWVRLVFGQFNVFDRRDEREGVVMLPASVVASTAAPAPVKAVPAPQPSLSAQAPQASQAASPMPALRATVAKGDTFDYRLTDRASGRQQTVVLRAERVVGGDVSFNSGARIESASGAVRISSALTGELDQVTPPGGWAPGGRVPAGSWKMVYPSIVPGSGMSYDLEAHVEGEQKMKVDGRDLRTVRISLRGWAENHNALVVARGTYQGTAWVSPELHRVVRYEVQSRSAGGGGGAFIIDEVDELVRIGND
ncbi:MAG: hypothetical protein KGL68_10070 [Burkholderiales bacterium]|nr:hypothetical protein [Burkholderiales bacterium]